MQSCRIKPDPDLSEAEVFIEPDSFKEVGTISLGVASFSEDGKILAYPIAEGGSDWRKYWLWHAIEFDIDQRVANDLLIFLV